MGSTPPRSEPIVRWLTELGVTDEWVVSCYLKLEPRDRARGKYLIKLKNRIRSEIDRLDQQGLTRAERESVVRDLERVQSYLTQPDNLPTGQGIAIFASEGLELFEAVPLPRVFRSRLAVDRSPLVRELAALDDEFGLVLTAVYDRTSARLFEVTAFGIRELSSLAATDSTRPGRFHGNRGTGTGAVGAAGEHKFNQRIREEKHRHYAAIAQRLFEAARERPARGIVLAGVGADADAVMPYLHPYLARQVLGTTKLNPRSVTPATVMDAVLAVRQESERALEAEHVGQFQDGLATGWAISGLEPVLQALAQGQIRILLVDPSAVHGGYRCGDTGRLTTLAEGCAGEGKVEAVADVVDEAIEDALRQGSHVEVLEDREVRRHVEGVGAILRFRTR